MLLLARNYLYHVVQNLRGRPSARWPLGAYLYLTYRCNLWCSYCNDGLGNKYPQKCIDRELSTEEWFLVLRVLRRVTDLVIFTGGEPTLRADLPQLASQARRLKYRPICLLTNLVNLKTVSETLHSIDLLSVSLDTLDSRKGDALLGLAGAHQRVLRNLDQVSQLRTERALELVLIACITPDTIDDARAVLDYALERGWGFAPAPASRGIGPVAGLAGNPRYETFIQHLTDLKRRGHNILGTLAYLEGIRRFLPYRCLPTLLARVKPNGELLYPCSKRFTSAGSLLVSRDYHKTVLAGQRQHGPVGSCEQSCHDGCYMDYSLVVQRPDRLVAEFWHRAVCRGLRQIRPSRRLLP